MEFLESKILPALATAIISIGVGVAAWVVTNFFAEPLLHFNRRRRDIRESVFFTRNVSPEWKPEIIIAAADELRRHAAGLEALWVTAPPSVKRCLMRRGYDLMAAASGLTGLSNSFLVARGERALHRDAIEKALKFPRSYSDEEIERIRQKLERED